MARCKVTARKGGVRCPTAAQATAAALKSVKQGGGVKQVGKSDQRQLDPAVVQRNIKKAAIQAAIKQDERKVDTLRLGRHRIVQAQEAFRLQNEKEMKAVNSKIVEQEEALKLLKAQAATKVEAAAFVDEEYTRDLNDHVKSILEARERLCQSNSDLDFLPHTADNTGGSKEESSDGDLTDYGHSNMIDEHLGIKRMTLSPTNIHSNAEKPDSVYSPKKKKRLTTQSRAD